MPAPVITYVAQALAIYIASMLLSKALAEEPEVSAFPISGIKSNVRSTQEILPIVYGHQRVGGNDVYAFTNGNDNDYLYLVQTLSEGTCSGIYQDTGVDQVWVDDKLYNEFGGNVSYWFHDGASDQTVDTTLNGVDGNWIDTLENTSYIVWKFTFDKDYFRGIPKRQVELKGIEVYDFRNDTTDWSDNAVLCLYDYFTNSRYGIGIDSSKIDITSWTASANYCDAQNFLLNMVINSKNNSMDIIDTILKHFRGHLTWFDGKFYLRYSDLYEESSVMTITDDHIYQEISGKSSIKTTQPGRFNKPDAIRVKFIDKEKSFTVDDFIVGDATGVVNDYELLGCTDRETAGILATSKLERLQLDRSIQGVFRDDCLELEPHDIITFNSNDLGISDQLMRIIETNLREDNLINMSLQYESYDIYNDVYDSDIEGTYTCNLPDPNAEPPGVRNATISESVYDYRLTTYSKLIIDFDDPLNYPWYNECEVWMTVVSGEASEPTESDYKHQFNTTTKFEIDPVDEGKDYWIVLKPINIWGVKTSWGNSTKLFKNIIGVSDNVPSSISALNINVNDNTINLYAEKLTDPDIEIYEFRMGIGGWSGGLFYAAQRSPNISIKGAKPGSHTFYCNTKSTNELYGASPKSASSVIQDPKGWTPDVYTYDDDYTAGSHDNTERVIYSATPHLKCTHSGSNLTGIYTSEVITASGGNDVYFTYIETDITVSGVGTRWSDIGADVYTWDEMNLDILNWSESFQTDEAPVVSIDLKYKINTGDAWSTVNKMEICSTVIEGQYFQVVITITDPQASINALIEEYTLHLYS